eukprot:TRINITY_DN9502_c0_g1_i3.p1 TRINITY_DN9502_c0_g1~~TRINITY_DN9502_c0_g1_i3.p1  ORF type:complete len:402 (+),score=81.89 TRINITY_DN9502_c0_g1_i3:354-1559(+)
MAKSKLERDLATIVFRMDPTNERILTFDTLGKLMRLLGIYRVLYNPAYHVLCRPNGDSAFKHLPSSLSFHSRKDKELEFQVNIWGLLKRKHRGYIDAEVAIELLLLLAAANKESVEMLGECVEELLRAADRAYGSVSGDDLGWSCEQLVKAYKELNPGPLIVPKLKEPVNASFSFNPRINERSRRLADRSLSHYLSHCNGAFNLSSDFAARVFLMRQKQLAVRQFVEHLRSQQMRAEVEECTFCPRLRVYRGRVQSAKRERSVWKTREEKELEECTFNPILCRLEGRSVKTPLPNGYDKVVQRMRNANKEKALEKENVSNASNCGRIKLKRAPGICSRKKSLLKIKVDVTTHRKGQITVKEGDNLQAIINNFAKSFQLPKTKTDYLYKKVKECISDLNIEC